MLPWRLMYPTIHLLLRLGKTVNELYCRNPLCGSCVIDGDLFSICYYKQITLYKNDKVELWKVREPRALAPQHLLLSLFCWDGGKYEVFFELNSHFFLITWDQGLVPVQESKGPHLEVTHLPATKEWTIPSTDQNSLCPDLVNTSLGVKQLEFCLSKEVNAVAKEYYCSKLLSNIRCWIQK